MSTRKVGMEGNVGAVYLSNEKFQFKIDVSKLIQSEFIIQTVEVSSKSVNR